MMTSVAVLTMLALADSVVARPEFRERVPNAYNVAGVEAIGHVNTEGGGARNAFGKDFDTAGRAWTKELCEKDSDGDGQTNGQELGDPCCAWVQTSNANVLWTTGVSAPGDATKKADPTLWANVSCAAGSSSNSATTSPTKSNSTTTTTSPTGKSGVASIATLALTASAVALVSAIFA